MKKRSNNIKPRPSTAKDGGKAVAKDKADDFPDDSEDEGIVSWMKTSVGMEYMTLFVILNSLVVFTTMSWPQMKQMYHIMQSYFNNETEEPDM